MIKLRTVAVLMASIVTLALTPGVASAASTTWNPEVTPANDGQQLFAVSCPGAKNCYANALYDSVVYHFNGTSWAPLSSEPSGDLAGISCTSSTSCIAVGWYNTAKGNDAGAWSWNGSAWTQLTTYQPKSNYNGFNAIRCAGPDSCEAVGWHGNCNPGTCGVFYPLAEYWNGSTWTQQSTTGSIPGSLYDLACSSTNACEGIGYNEFSGTQLAMRWNGTKWSDQKLPRQVGSELPAISCNGTASCMAVGFTSGGQSLVETWNGTKWTAQPVGSVGTNVQLWNVHCVNISDCTVVGSNGNAFAATWNGSTWTANTVNGGSGGLLFGLSCTSSACTAVGYNSGDNSLAERN